MGECMNTLGKTAVVLGGSVAGLCAAGALADRFDRVIVLERDELPADAEHRRGVPQSKHPHFLLNGGRRAIGALFPGFEDDLIAAGGMLLMPSHDAAYLEKDGWAPRKQSTMTMVYSSRILIERVLRDRVRAVPHVTIREGVTVQGLMHEGRRDRATAASPASASSWAPPTPRRSAPTSSSTPWGGARR